MIHEKRLKLPKIMTTIHYLKEVEIYYLCSGHPTIIQLVEYFEEEDYFYLVFEKANGGPLLGQVSEHCWSHDMSLLVTIISILVTYGHKSCSWTHDM